MSAPRDTRAPLDQLTPREAEIVELLALGLSNKEISARLGIAINTIRAHCVNAFEKMGVHNRTAAAIAHVKRKSP